MFAPPVAQPQRSTGEAKEAGHTAGVHARTLPRGIGNQARLRSLSASPPPATGKLNIGFANDPLELDADAVAEEVLRRPGAAGPRQPTRASTTTSGVGAPNVVRSVIATSGEPLDGAARAFFEPRFGTDLSAVRIHADAAAAESARSVGATAYAVGSHIAFAADAYAPGTGAGHRLLAHELAHVLQQDRAPAPWLQRQIPAGKPTAPTRVVVLDNDVVGEIADGNPRGAVRLLNMVRSNVDLRIWRGTYNELVRGNPRQAGARRLIVQQFNIKIDEGGDLVSRAPTYERIGGKGEANPQLKDTPMLGAVAAMRAQGGATANAEIMSLDGGVQKNALLLGIPVAVEGTEFGERTQQPNVRTGLDNLGLTDWDVAADGNARRLVASGSLPSRLPPASTPESDEQRGSVRGPGTYQGVRSGETVKGETDLGEGDAPGRLGTGTAIATGAAMLGLQIIGSLITNKYITRPSFERQMKALGPTITQRIKEQEEFPLTRLVANPDTPMYAQITIESDNTFTFSESPSGQAHADQSVIPNVSLKSVLVTTYPAEGKDFSIEGHPYISVTKEYYTYSVHLNRPPFENLIAFAVSRHLTLSGLRRYAQKQLGTASQWVKATKDDPDMFEIAKDFDIAPERPAQDAAYWQGILAQLARYPGQ